MEGVALVARSLRLADLAVPRTIGAGRLWPPLRIVGWPGHTEIRIEGRATPLSLTRNAHSLIRETARLTRGGGSAHWQEVAERIWRFGAVEDTVGTRTWRGCGTSCGRAGCRRTSSVAWRGGWSWRCATVWTW
ncbi:MAG: hypothetical protein ABIO70_16715 [Pseudomonadota bacterium]